MNPTKLNLWLDAIIGVAFVLALASGLSAQPVHGRMEFHGFVSLVLSIGVALHLVLHRKWLAVAARSGRKPASLTSNLWLDRLLGLTFLLTLLSGLHGHRDPVYGTLPHVLATISLIIVLALHLGQHWKWIVITTRKYWK